MVYFPSKYSCYSDVFCCCASAALDMQFILSVNLFFRYGLNSRNIPKYGICTVCRQNFSLGDLIWSRQTNDIKKLKTRIFIIIWLSSLSGLYAKWCTLIGWLAVQYVFRTDRLVLAGKFPSWFEEKQSRFRYVLQKICKNKLREKKLNV